MTTNSRLLFSGHQTFVLRSHWLKKAYDLTSRDPAALTDERAIVAFGVGKNMVESIRYWGRVSGLLAAQPNGGYAPTELAAQWLADDGWDPYMVRAASGWLLHWLLCSSLQAFSWYATFNLWRAPEAEPDELVRFVAEQALLLGGVRPAVTTLSRDINTLMRCYLPPTREQIARDGEDLVLSPLQRLNLVQAVTGQTALRFTIGAHETLPDALVYLAALHQLQQSSRTTLAFPDLAYAPQSPGRIFRLDEDTLLATLLRAEEQTDGLLSYSDHAGHRQLMVQQEHALTGNGAAQQLLAQIFQVTHHA